MAKRYDTYGFRTTLDEAAAFVASALGIDLDTGDSSYYGGSYYRFIPEADRRLRLYNNVDARSGAIVRSAHSEYPVLLEVSNLEDMDAVRKRLTEGREDPLLLVSRELDDEPDPR
jgi:hypothetical protein